MKNLLLVTSSPRGEASHSTSLAGELADGLARTTGATIARRELWRDPLPEIGPAFVHASYTPAEARTPEQDAALADSNAVVAEVQAADTLVIGAGMINFGAPAALKTWIDHLARRGLTFRYGEAGPEGLLRGKRAILILASGAVYSAGPYASFNHLEPPIRSVLAFLGITDVETVWVEGVAAGEEATTLALAAARERIEAIVAREAVAPAAV